MANARRTTPADDASQTTQLAVVDPKTTALASVDEALLATIIGDAGRDGGITAKDVAIPFLKVVQALTPERQRSSDKYIAGLEEGDILDAATGRFWKGSEGIVVIPVRFQRSYTEWKPKRGGFVADYGTDDTVYKTGVKDAEGRIINPKTGNVLQEAMLYYVFVVDPTDGSYQQNVLSLTSTQMRKARKWNAELRAIRATNPANGGSFNPPIFFTAFRITTVPENKGEHNWMGVRISLYKETLHDSMTIRLPYGGATYMAARELDSQVASGQVKAQAPTEDAVVEEIDPAAEPGSEAVSGAGDPTDFEFPE